MRRINRCWLGPRPMPSRFRRYGELWQELNPETEVIDWSWNNLPEDLPCLDVMEDLRQRCTSGTSTELPTQLADILGYWFSSQGDIYANADIRPVRSVPEEMWNSDFVTFEEREYELCVNAFTGGRFGSSFWQFVLDGISESYFSQPPNTEMVFTTGPIYLTARMKQWKDIGNEEICPVTVYPWYTVNPILWKDVPQGSYGSDMVDLNNLPEGCIGIHDWWHRVTGRSNVVS